MTKTFFLQKEKIVKRIENYSLGMGYFRLQMYYGYLHLKNFLLSDVIFIHINLEKDLFFKKSHMWID